MMIFMPAAKRVSADSKFDDAMRRLMKVPPPPSGKKAKRKTAPKSPVKKSR
jgi:hypothetical protein